jgi:autotransporter-associated beta strand protein
VTFKGPGTTVLAGDASVPDANHYTGGTYIRSGTVILQAAGAGNGSTVGGSHAVDSIEALDTGATLKFGTIFDGTSWVSAPSQEQIGANIPGTRMIMTGGTLDLNNDPKNQRVRCPDGFGLIINNGSSVQAGLNVIMDGLDHTFSGVIADGNNGALIGDNSGQGPGYQIGIVSISGTAGSTWTLAGDNTYSGSTRIDGGTIVKLAGNHSLGIPTTNSLTGPLRVQNGALDLNGRDQTIALMTDGGGAAVKIYNSAVGTVSTLTVGYGNEQASRNIGYQLMDNTGVGGKFALRKIITAPYLLGGIPATNCTQGLKNICVATYSGDTTVDGGTLSVQGPSAISPNSAYRLSTNNYANLWLNYSGDAPCRQLWINGVQQPNGTYGAGTPGIDPTSTGTITVTGFAPVVLGTTKSGNTVTFSWAGVYKLQSKTNSIIGPWFDYPGGAASPVNVQINPTNRSVFYRLATFP